MAEKQKQKQKTYLNTDLAQKPSNQWQIWQLNTHQQQQQKDEKQEVFVPPTFKLKNTDNMRSIIYPENFRVSHG